MNNKTENTDTAQDTPKQISASAVKKCLMAIKTDFATRLKAVNAGYKESHDDFDELDISDFLSETTSADFESLTAAIASSGTRGLPLDVQLANLEVEITAHYAKMPIKGNQAQLEHPDYREWRFEASRLDNKQVRLEKAIAKADSEQSGAASA